MREKTAKPRSATVLAQGGQLASAAPDCEVSGNRETSGGHGTMPGRRTLDKRHLHPPRGHRSCSLSAHRFCKSRDVRESHPVDGLPPTWTNRLMRSLWWRSPALQFFGVHGEHQSEVGLA